MHDHFFQLAMSQMPTKSLVGRLRGRSKKKKAASPKRKPSPVPLTPPRPPTSGFIPTPSPTSAASSVNGTIRTLFEVDEPLQRPPSPARYRDRKGRLLSDYSNVMIDVCSMTLTLTHFGKVAPSAHLIDEEMQALRDLLQREGIRFEPLASHFPEALRRITVQLTTPRQMHRLVCKLGGRFRFIRPD